MYDQNQLTHILSLDFKSEHILSWKFRTKRIKRFNPNPNRMANLDPDQTASNSQSDQGPGHLNLNQYILRKSCHITKPRNTPI